MFRSAGKGKTAFVSKDEIPGITNERSLEIIVSKGDNPTVEEFRLICQEILNLNPVLGTSLFNSMILNLCKEGIYSKKYKAVAELEEYRNVISILEDWGVKH